MYGKEQTEQEAKIAAMREDDSKDEYDVRKQEEVLAETVAMIPDTRGRLERGHEDLEELLVRRRPAPPRHDSIMLHYVHSLPRYTQPPLPPSQASSRGCRLPSQTAACFSPHRRFWAGTNSMH